MNETQLAATCTVSAFGGCALAVLNIAMPWLQLIAVVLAIITGADYLWKRFFKK